MPEGCKVTPVVQHRDLAKFLLSGACWCRTPACSDSVCRYWSPLPWRDPLDGSRKTHAQQQQTILDLCSAEPVGGLRICPFGQCRRGGIWHMNTVHYSLAGTWGALLSKGSWRDGRWPGWLGELRPYEWIQSVHWCGRESQIHSSRHVESTYIIKMYPLQLWYRCKSFFTVWTMQVSSMTEGHGSTT